MELLPEDIKDGSDDRAVAVLRAVAHPIRFRIMRVLADKRRFGVDDDGCCPRRELCVCRINELFDISAPTLSHHLRLLRDAGLIEGRREGVWIYYAVRPEAISSLQSALGVITPYQPKEE